MVESSSDKAPLYAIFSIPLSLSPAYVQRYPQNPLLQHLEFVKHFIVQLMHTNYKILRLLK